MRHADQLLAEDIDELLGDFDSTGLRHPEIDEQLGRLVDHELNSWLKDMGLLDKEFGKIGTYGLGRFAMLCYPGGSSVQRLTLAAKYFAALFILDDHYCDDESRGGMPTVLGERLTLAAAVVDPVCLPATQLSQYREFISNESVLRTWQVFMGELGAVASPSQLGRIRHEIVNMFLSMTGEAAWRLMKKIPRRWEYAVNRQFNGALPCTALIDVVGGYELSADNYYDSAVRRCSILAANAVMLGNDLFSARKEALTKLEAFNLPRIIESEDECSSSAALERTATVYKEAVSEFRDEQRQLFNRSASTLQRYLHGLDSWITGSLEWYRHTMRYAP